MKDGDSYEGNGKGNGDQGSDNGYGETRAWSIKRDENGNPYARDYTEIMNHKREFYGDDSRTQMIPNQDQNNDEYGSPTSMLPPIPDQRPQLYDQYGRPVDQYGRLLDPNGDPQGQPLSDEELNGQPDGQYDPNDPQNPNNPEEQRDNNGGKKFIWITVAIVVVVALILLGTSINWGGSDEGTDQASGQQEIHQPQNQAPAPAPAPGPAPAPQNGNQGGNDDSGVIKGLQNQVDDLQNQLRDRGNDQQNQDNQGNQGQQDQEQSVVIPNVIGQTAKEGKKALDGAGLGKVNYIDPEGGKVFVLITTDSHIITNIDPASGATIGKNDEVNVVVEKQEGQ